MAPRAVELIEQDVGRTDVQVAAFGGGGQWARSLSSRSSFSNSRFCRPISAPSFRPINCHRRTSRHFELIRAGRGWIEHGVVMTGLARLGARAIEALFSPGPVILAVTLALLAADLPCRARWRGCECLLPARNRLCQRGRKIRARLEVRRAPGKPAYHLSPKSQVGRFLVQRLWALLPFSRRVAGENRRAAFVQRLHGQHGHRVFFGGNRRQHGCLGPRRFDVRAAVERRQARHFRRSPCWWERSRRCSQKSGAVRPRALAWAGTGRSLADLAVTEQHGQAFRTARCRIRPARGCGIRRA